MNVFLKKGGRDPENKQQLMVLKVIFKIQKKVKSKKDNFLKLEEILNMSPHNDFYKSNCLF